ncbi:hypothetical protein ACF0H5_014400 [Mactra antiquata]
MRRILIIITMTWLTCIVCAVVSTIFFQDGATLYPCNLNYQSQHLEIWNFREGFVTFPSGVCCLILVGCFYFCMLKTLRKHGNKFNKNNQRFKNRVHPRSSERANKGDNFRLNPTTTRSNATVQNISQNRTSNATILTKQFQSGKTDGDESPHLSSLRKETTTNQESGDEPFSEIYAYTRSVSVRKTRDVVYLPSSGRLRFPSFAKQVVSIKRHQRKSLERWKPAQSKLDNLHNISETSDTKTEENKTPANIKCFSEHSQPPGNVEIKNQTGSVSNETVSSELSPNKGSEHTIEIESVAHKEYLHIRISNERENQRGKEKGTINSDKCTTLDTNVKTSCELYRDSGPAKSTSSMQNMPKSTRVYSSDELRSDMNLLTESKMEHSTYDSTLQTSDRSLNTKLSKTNAHLTSVNNSEKLDNVNGKVSPELDIKDNSESDIKQSEVKSVNEIDLSSDKKIDKDNAIIELQQKDHVDEHVVMHRMSNSDESKKEKRKPKIESKSQVDIVDFDGTVHKDVVVEGAVVGAVCVMNKSNKLEGRRSVEMRAAKRIAVMIGLFVLLWIPLPLAVVIASSRHRLSPKDIETLLLSASINASTVAVNPVLNLLLNKQLRSAAMTLIKRTTNSFRRAVMH